MTASTADFPVWTHKRSARRSVIVAVVASMLAHVALAFVMPAFGVRIVPDETSPTRLRVVVMPAKPEPTPEPVFAHQSTPHPHPHPHPHKSEQPAPKPIVPKREHATTVSRAPEIDRAPAPTQPVPLVTHAPEPITPSAMKVEPAPVPEQRVTVTESAANSAKEPVPVNDIAPKPARPVELASARPSLGEGLEPPHYNVAYLKDPKLDYPAAARRLRLQGTVVVRVQVSAAGLPESLKLAQSSGAELLDETALNAIRGWRFAPARRGSEPVAHWVDVPIRFRLTD